MTKKEMVARIAALEARLATLEMAIGFVRHSEPAVTFVRQRFPGNTPYDPSLLPATWAR